MHYYFSLFFLVISFQLFSSDLLEGFLQKHQKQILIHGVRKKNSLKCIFEMGEVTTSEKVFLKTGCVQGSNKGIQQPLNINKKEEQKELSRLLTLFRNVCVFPEIEQDVCFRENHVSISLPWGATFAYDAEDETFNMDTKKFKKNPERLSFLQEVGMAEKRLGYSKNQLLVKLYSLEDEERNVDYLLSKIFDGFIERFSDVSENKKRELMFFCYQALGEYRVHFYNEKFRRYLLGVPRNPKRIECRALHRVRNFIKEGFFFYLPALNSAEKWKRIWGSGGTWVVYGYNEVPSFTDKFYPFLYYCYGEGFEHRIAVEENTILPIANKGKQFSLSVYDPNVVLIGTRENLEPYIKEYPDFQYVFFEDITEDQKKRLLGEE